MPEGPSIIVLKELVEEFKCKQVIVDFRCMIPLMSEISGEVPAPHYC